MRTNTRNKKENYPLLFTMVVFMFVCVCVCVLTGAAVVDYSGSSPHTHAKKSLKKKSNKNNK